MVMAYSALRDEIEQQLQDTGNAEFTTAEIDLWIAQGLRELSNYKPHIVRETYTIESRIGTATSTTAGSLIDATKSQFVSGDVGKIIFNDTDNTWAEIVTFTSATALVLSKDIMVSGEKYRMFNKECFSDLEINIEDIGDYIYVDNVEYPLNARRNFTMRGTDKLRLVLDTPPADSNNTSSDVEVYVDFAKRHKLSQLTDFAGAVNNGAGYAAGSTSMAIDALNGSEVIEVDQEFTVAGVRGIYRVTTALTLSGGTGTLSAFYPGLESAVADDDVVTFTQSTLDYEDERLVIDLITARALLNKLTKFATNINVNAAAFRETRQLATDKLTLALSELRKAKKQRVAKIYTRGMVSGFVSRGRFR